MRINVVVSVCAWGDGSSGIVDVIYSDWFSLFVMSRGDDGGRWGCVCVERDQETCEVIGAAIGS